MSCRLTQRLLHDSAARRTLTTLLVAVGSTLVMALAGCADPSGIAPRATLLAPGAVGVPPAGAVATASPTSGAATAGAATASPTTAGSATIGGPAGADAVAASRLAPDWWRAFDDPVLDDLIARATSGNPNLRVAAARGARAAANVDAARANEGPQVAGSLDASRQRFSETYIYPPPLGGSTRELASAQLNGSWELDLFGRNRAQLDSTIGAERAARADVDAARVLLSVNVARTYLQLARLLEQRDVLGRALAQRDELLGLTRQRVSAGLDTVVELRQSEGALPETRQQLESLDEQVALARNALAALCAEPADRFAALSPQLARLRALELPAVVPADLVGRRADLVAARWRVEAAAGDVRVARAQFYPNVNLTAFVGLSSLGFDRLLRSGSAQYGAGPAVRLPIFESGRLRAGLSGRTADLDAAVETWNQTLVDAVHDVVDQIASVRSVERQAREQDAAQAAAESAYDLATQRYRAGLSTYLTVLNAESNVIAQRRLATDLRARSIDARLLLVRSLGGGYAGPADDAEARTLLGAAR